MTTTEPLGTPQEEWKACAVCARVLEIMTDRNTGEQTWRHPSDMILEKKEDHEVQPVPMESVDLDLRCDFCFMVNPTWVVPARNFEYDWLPPGFPYGMQSTNDWAACDICAELVNRGLWSGLHRRALAAYMGKHPDHNAEATDFMLTRLYRQLRKNVRGAPFRR